MEDQIDFGVIEIALIIRMEEYGYSFENIIELVNDSFCLEKAREIIVNNINKTKNEFEVNKFNVYVDFYKKYLLGK